MVRVSNAKQEVPMFPLFNSVALEALSTPALEALRIALRQMLYAPWLTDGERAALLEALALIGLIVSRRLAPVPSP
jgi:hypothetical protein